MTRFLEKKKLLEMPEQMSQALEWILEDPKINKDPYSGIERWDSQAAFIRAAVENFLLREGGIDYQRWLNKKRGEQHAQAENDLRVRHGGQDVQDPEEPDPDGTTT